MIPSNYTEVLLEKWGLEWFSEDLGYPHRCPSCSGWRHPGYRVTGVDIDSPVVEQLAMFMPENLSPMKIHVLRVRYRMGIRDKRKAAKRMRISELRYRQYYNQAIDIIETRFFGDTA